eukprot:1169356-Amphidinium_carterae.2
MNDTITLTLLLHTHRCAHARTHTHAYAHVHNRVRTARTCPSQTMIVFHLGYTAVEGGDTADRDESSGSSELLYAAFMHFDGQQV